eukprot:TRINITY_DN508_c0_g1_i8.p1 TRINITY_DN508_c0_g1~~TRINITY_DN508_c0_g1_i8.p1  ORF type:complete len:589 (-),score=93.38 TRINITY_DN508_c0_g1_i8:594-2360(-)
MWRERCYPYRLQRYTVEGTTALQCLIAMEALALPLPLTLSLSFPRRARASVVKARAKGAGKGTAIVWFKHDLRTDDHPGLCQASQYDSVVPLFVFDPHFYSGFSTAEVGVVMNAVRNLREELRDSASDLIIRCGSTKHALLTIAEQVNAGSIITENEVEYEWARIVESVSDCIAGKEPQLIFWQAHLFEFKSWDQLPESYKELQKMQCPLLEPLPRPQLPLLPVDVDRGDLPNTNSLRESASVARFGASGNGWSGIKLALQNEKHAILSEEGEQNVVINGKTQDVLNALDGYLRYFEATGRDDWQEVHDRVRPSEYRVGASFRAIFGQAMSMGIISRRRIYHKAIEYELDRNAGWINPFGYSAFTISAAIEDSKSIEWYQILALKDQQKGIMEGLPIRTWKWHGYLIQYTTAGNKGPAIVLVHGFGAFWGHYRDNIYPISKQGFRVYAITLLGFGRSEKPNIIYSEHLWAELLRDFVLDVVGEPAHIVGNSFGGYVASFMASFWPEVTKSLILCNPGGNVVPNYSNVKYLKSDPNSSVSKIGARFLLFYLRLRAERILRSFYPVKPERANERLLEEILRSVSKLQINA